jgi:hypothetical protein
VEAVISDSQEALQQLILEAIAELQVVASATGAADEQQHAGGPPGEERRASEAWLAAESIMSGARRSSDRIVAKARLAAEGVLRDALVASERVAARSDQAAEEIAGNSFKLKQRISSKWSQLGYSGDTHHAGVLCNNILSSASKPCSAAVKLICSGQGNATLRARSAQQRHARDACALQRELARAVSERRGDSGPSGGGQQEAWERIVPLALQASEAVMDASLEASKRIMQRAEQASEEVVAEARHGSRVTVDAAEVDAIWSVHHVAMKAVWTHRAKVVGLIALGVGSFVVAGVRLM